MRIKRLEINKYKSIKVPFILENPGKLHFFIGSNNAGKTNILDALYQLYGGNNKRFYDKNINIKVEFTLKSKYGRRLIVNQIGKSKIFILDNKEITSIRGNKILSHHIIRLRATKPIPVKVLTKEFNNLKSRYPKIYKIFCDTLSKHIPQISFTKEFFNKNLILEHSKLRPFDRLGDGFQQVFIILMYLFDPQYKILLLDEPEIHLHPALIKKLLTILEHKNLDNQIFLTTHSPLFIHTTNLHRLFRVTRGLKSTKIFSPRLTGIHLNYTRLKQELNADNCEMFFADKVLLVEGPSDHILLRELINRFYQGDKDIKVIQTYGKSNIDIYSKLLDVFKIPYTVLLDRDALYDTGIKLIQEKIKNKITRPEKELISMLKKYNVFVLPNGSIENNYPRRYQRRHKHKPQNALYAAFRISKYEYNSPIMRNLKEVINNL